jgi:hypothetical protein
MVAYLDQAGVQHLIAKIRNTFWPVDTILATSSNTSPASYIGGSWEAYAPGRTLVGVDEKHPLNSIGGSETHSHNSGTLSAQVSLDGQNTVVRRVAIPAFSGDVRHIGDIYGGSFNATWGAAIVGHSSDASSMEPYVVVRYWRRVA